MKMTKDAKDVLYRLLFECLEPQLVHLAWSLCMSIEQDKPRILQHGSEAMTKCRCPEKHALANWRIFDEAKDDFDVDARGRERETTTWQAKLICDVYAPPPHAHALYQSQHWDSPGNTPHSARA